MYMTEKMTNLQSQIYDNIGAVEDYIYLKRENYERESIAIETTSKRISELLNSFNLKEDEEVKYIEPMRVSLPNHSVLDSFFKEEPNNGFLFGEDREEKRKKLAAERRAEYIAYLEKKERELQKKRQSFEEVSATSTPRSIMESVDYETILAKRREEELKFRQIHHAEPSLSNGVNNEKVSVLKKPKTPDILPFRENNVKNMEALNIESKCEDKQKLTVHNSTASPETRYIPQRPLSSQENHFRRTGGGGEPVKDSFGNLIIARGFKEVAPILAFPSFQQNNISKSNLSYKEELAKQIEDKKRFVELERQRAEELEKKEEEKIAEHWRKMELEFQNKHKATSNVKEQKQQERLQQLEEFKRKDEEMKQRLRRNRAAEIRHQTNENVPRSAENRSSSPPIPAMRTKIIYEKQNSPEVLNKVIVPHEKHESLIISAAEIRRKIMQDCQNLNRNVKGTYEVMNRRTVHDDDEDDYDMR